MCKHYSVEVTHTVMQAN